MSDKKLRPAWGLAYGTAFGWIVSALALLMSVGGHGWTSSTISFGAIIVGPLIGYGLFARRTMWGSILLCAGTASLVIMDLWIVIQTVRFEANYLSKVSSLMPLVFCSWLGFWLGGHVLIVKIAHTSNVTPGDGGG